MSEMNARLHHWDDYDLYLSGSIGSVGGVVPSGDRWLIWTLDSTSDGTYRTRAAAKRAVERHFGIEGGE